MRLTLILIFLFAIDLNAQLPDLGTGAGDVYGSYCGIVGTHPPSRLLIEKWIKEENLESITGWLASPNKVKQVYAIEALIRLDLSIYNLDETFLEKIDVLRESEEYIPTCSGCIYQDRTIGEIISDLEET